MKIKAFFSSVYPNGFTPMSMRLHYYMKALKSKNVDVEVIMPSEYEKDGGVFEEIPYSFTKVVKKNRINGRIVARSYAHCCAEIAKSCDILFLISSNNYMLKLITKAVHEQGKKVVIEQNENPFVIFGSRLDTQFTLNIRRKIFLHRRLPMVDGIIVISNALHDLISSYKRKDALVVRIPILCGEIEETTNPKNGKMMPPYILHAGTLSEQKDGIIAMFEAFSIAHKKLNGNLQFILTQNKGFPKLLSKINKIIENNHLEKDIIFKGIISKEELKKLRKNCVLAIVNKPSNSQNDFNFPTKLTELLMDEVPLILSKTGEINNYFVDKEAAYMVEPDNIEQIADKIIYIIEHPEEARQVAQNGKKLAQNEFYYMNYADDLYKFFTEIKHI